jgi:hypothetical protein
MAQVTGTTATKTPAGPPPGSLPGEAASQLVQSQPLTGGGPPHGNPPLRPCTEGAIGLTEHRAHSFEHTVPAGTPVEYLTRSEYWANVVAQRFQPTDRIHCHDASGRWYCELIVRRVSQANLARGIKGSVLVAPLRLVRFDVIDEKPKSSKAEDYEVRWISPQEKWGVFRRSDGNAVSRNLETNDIARQHLDAMLLPPA